MSVKNIIKKFIPAPILIEYKRLKLKLGLTEEGRLISAQRDFCCEAVKKVRAKKDPINVVFFAIFDSVWKYDELYRLMEGDERFNPTILVCPVVDYSRENMLMNMKRCYDLFKKRGYNVIRAYDEDTDQYVDVRKEFSPDIIFYTNPYGGLIDSRYYISAFKDILTVYVSYNFPNAKDVDFNYGQLLHNLVWRRYVETSGELVVANSYFKNINHNARFTGYPGIDRFIMSDSIFKDDWKIKDRNVKRIIWSPHHTITPYVAVFYSTFLEYCDFMFEMAQKYKDSIQIAFKPHPILKNRLELMWGEKKTKEYYDKWASLPNGMLNDGAYEDLFMTSDAIMHDCGSFIGEYLYTKNPALFLSNGIPFNEQYNDLAQSCLENYYVGKNKEDIENFIVNVIDGKDPLKQKREEFYRTVLLPPNGKLASENIIDDLVKELRS